MDLQEKNIFSKKYLAVLLLCLLQFSLSACTRTDANLNTEALEFLELVESPKKSAAYLYLLGIEAPEDMDPIELGSSILNENKASRELKLIDLSIEKDGKHSELFCHAFKNGCLNRLFSLEYDIEELRTQYKTLISRSRMFYRLNDFKTLTRSATSPIHPKYTRLVAFERLEVLSAISEFREGHVESAVGLLLNQVERLRHGLSQQDSLIGKMIFVTNLSEVVDVASIILSKHPLEAVNKIPKLSTTEKDLTVVAAREFVVSYDAVKTVFSAPRHNGDKTLYWILQFFFKPDMTVNAFVPVYTRIHTLAQLTPTQFVAALANQQRSTLESPTMSNALGNYLNSSESDYGKYVARLHDFDVKLELFNHRYHSNLEFESVSNPYYPDEQPMFSEGLVCFRGPVENEHIKCLRVSTHSSMH